MSLLRRAISNRDDQIAGDELRSGTISFQQLAMLMQQEAGGPSVTSIDQAMRDTATWACLHVKARGIASLPVDVVRYDGRRRIPVPSPEIVTNPGAVVPRHIWLYQLAMSMFSDSNVFGIVVDADDMGRPTKIILQDPEACRQRKVVDGVKQVTINGTVHRQHPWGDLWHMAGEVVMPGSPFGLSPITYGGRTTGTALAAEKFGGQFFSDGGHPTWLLSPESDPGEEGAKLIKAKFLAAINGNREPVVVPKNTGATQLSSSPGDSALMDLMRFEVEQTCRRHGVPPTMVYAAVSGQNVTYSNVTQADLHYLKHTLSWPIDLIEAEWSRLLPDDRFVKLRRDAILRGDPKARWEIHDLRLRNKTTTINDVRALEDEEPWGPTFDEPGIPTATDPEVTQ